MNDRKVYARINQRMANCDIFLEADCVYLLNVSIKILAKHVFILI